MKWFKHFSNAKFDKKVMRVVDKYGLKGYGLYFAIVEWISYQLESENPYPDLEEDASDIARFFNDDQIKIEEMVQFMVKEGLFQINESNRISCLKLLAHLDNTMSSNPEIKKILSNFKKLEVNSSELNKLNTDQIRSDKIKLDQNILNKKGKKNNKKPTLKQKSKEKDPILESLKSHSLKVFISIYTEINNVPPVISKAGENNNEKFIKQCFKSNSDDIQDTMLFIENYFQVMKLQTLTYSEGFRPGFSLKKALDRWNKVVPDIPKMMTGNLLTYQKNPNPSKSETLENNIREILKI